MCPVLATQAEHPYDVAAAVLEAFRRTFPELLEGKRYVRTDPSPSWCGYADVTVRATAPGVQDLPAGGGKGVSLTAGEWQVT